MSNRGWTGDSTSRSTPEFTGKSRIGNYGDAIMGLDARTGEVLADPREENNVFGTAAWVIGPYLNAIGEYMKTLEKYPNPKPVNLTEFGK